MVQKRASSNLCRVMHSFTPFLALFSAALICSVQASSKYGDVNGDEVVIDELQQYLRSRGQERSPNGHFRQSENDYRLELNAPIEFAVTPEDPRYYLPPVNAPREYIPRAQIPRGFISREQPLVDYSDEAQQAEEDASYLSGLWPSPRESAGPPAWFKARESNVQQQQALMSPQQVEPHQFKKHHKKQIVPEVEEKNTDKLGDESGDISEKKKSELDAVHRDATRDAEDSKPSNLKHSAAHAEAPGYQLREREEKGMSDVYFTMVVAGCTAIAVCAVIGTGFCWYKLHKSHRAAADAEYPAYGITGPNKDLSPSADRKLAQSAHMYHYQHQKQQMIALEKNNGSDRHGSASDVDSDEEGEEGDYTVYECPGLAPTGEMEVKNPLFHDDPTPATPSVVKQDPQETD